MKRILFLLNICLIAGCSDSSWTLINPSSASKIYLSENAGGPVQQAVEDLISDIEKITGQKMEISSNLNSLGENPILVLNLENEEDKTTLARINENLDSLDGQWESYVVYLERNSEDFGQPLVMAGSNELGTVFSIYHFIEKYLQVDPFYYWTDMEPEKQSILTFEDISIIQEEPDFKYRGWFINDEDLLTEFINGAGNRYIDYRYYDQVVHPEVIDRVMEALVRSRYNLTIPASFIDIMNPPERRLVEAAARRGLYISQHHIEPVGVSAFSFFNYWKAKGQDHRFSFFSSRPQLEEVWEAYVEEWAKIPKVVWQVGLRGIADRPMWLADPSVPQSDAERGQLISEAMQVQVDLIKKYDERKDPPITTTLWAEGAALNEVGHLRFPEDIIVVFADNSPGFVWQEDFYETEREKDRKYGVYYHHQLWGSGPHLAQAVPPAKTHEMFQLAYEHKASHFAIMNVSNIREFVLGIEASAAMLDDITGFDADQYLKTWCEERFDPVGELAYKAYKQFFDSYQIHPETITPYTLDGQMRSYAMRILNDIEKQLDNPEAFDAELQRRNKRRGVDALGMDLSDAYPHQKIPPAEYLSVVQQQLARLEQCMVMIPEIKDQLSGTSRQFFQTNYETQVLILTGITQWLERVLQAKLALQFSERETCLRHLGEALEALKQVEQGKELSSYGKWEHWYRGDKKMNMPGVKNRTSQVLNYFSN